MNKRTNGSRFATCCLAIVAIALGGAGSAAAVAPNDNFVSAVPLVIGQPDTRFSNLDATTEAGEALTAQSGDRPFCGYAGGLTSQTAFTLWWTVRGTGRRVRVTTEGSNFDTHLGIFHGSINDPSLMCFDGAPNEFFEFDTNPGQLYHVQVGACVQTATPFNPACPATTATAVSVLATSAAAGNDNRAAAAALTTGQLASGDNFAATEEAAEPMDCATPRGTSPYGRTVWYRWTAPGAGTAVFTATGFDTVLAVFPAGANAPLQCDDDPAVSGPSRIQTHVSAGEYFVQVAGFGRHSGFADSAQGQFNVSAEFAADPPPPPPDADGDGIPDNGADGCPTVKPTVDVNKDGCQDKPKRIAADLKYKFNPYRRSGRLRGFALSNVRLVHAPKGARVRVSCARCQRADTRGRTRRFRGFTTTVRKAGGTQPLSSLNRLLLPRGGALVIVVTNPGQLGRRISVKSGRSSPANTPSCLALGSASKRVACSSGS